MTTALKYPEQEEGRREELARFFDTWKDAIVGEFPEVNKWFVSDGFFPHFYSQPLKILFIGRESRSLGGCDYIEEMAPAYQLLRKVGKQSLNQSRYHSTILYIVYALLRGERQWEHIPNASEIGPTVGTPGGISFALMNVSKTSNERADTWHSQWDEIGRSVQAARGGRTVSFIEQQIALLEPDLVFSMNLGGLLDHLGTRSSEVDHSDLERFQLDSAGHRSVLFNTWHFSAPNKSPRKHIFEPTMEAFDAAMDDGWFSAS